MSEKSGSVTIPQAVQIAFEHIEAGNLQKAETILRQILEVQPNHSDALHLLGIIGLQAGDFEGAREAIAKAVDLEPSNPYFLNSLGNAYLKLNRDVDAESCFRRSVALATENFEAHNNLAAVLKRLGRLEDAERSARQALALEPDYVEAHNNLGNILFEMVRLEEAGRCFERALALKPGYAEAQNNRGNVLWRLGRMMEAEQSYRLAVKQKPAYAEAHNNLGNVLCDTGRMEDGERCYRRALELKPGYAKAHCNLANALLKMEREEEAAQSYRRALAIDPEYAEAHSNLGLALDSLGQSEEAEQCCRRALALKPDSAEAEGKLGFVVSHTGRLEEAQEHYRRSLALNPDLPMVHSNLIMALDLSEQSGIREQQDERRRWFERHCGALAGSFPPHAVDPDRKRRLRVGYVSSDFYRHSASHIFGPIIRSHDRGAMEVVCYSGGRREDEVTAGLKRASQLWRTTVGVSDEALAEQIRADRIDILVDLSGHSGGNRLLVFASKPAPVQITAWGYATGTGLPTIDCFFADAVVVVGEERKYFAEQVVDLACCVCYEAPEYAPEIAPLPSLAGKPFTFGCLNRIEKISDRSLELWARLLEAAADSRMLIKDTRLDDAQTREQLHRRLAAHGIGRDRVKLLGHTSHARHLETYRDVDLALDPYPHGGGVSSMEALWMGVPVVTLIGSTIPSRLSASILTALAMQDWIAKSDEEYVRKALDAARHLPRLAALRTGLRTRMRKSIVGDVQAYTRAVELAYRTAWRRWCEQVSR